MSENLKKCPFCGGEVDFETKASGGFCGAVWNEYWCIKCNKRLKPVPSWRFWDNNWYEGRE